MQGRALAGRAAFLGDSPIDSAAFNRRRALELMVGATAAACALPSWASQAGSARPQLTGDLAPVHDPCIVRAGDHYHLFSTGNLQDATGLLPWRISRDLVTWELHGNVLDSIPKWALEAVPNASGLWAPDVAYVSGRYLLYYSVSSFGSNRSLIGLLSTPTLDRNAPDFAWRDDGMIVESRVGDEFNAIDSSHIVDRNGRRWLALGSYFGGLKMFELDRESGKVTGKHRQYSLASRPVPHMAPMAIEAPFLIERDGFYYLFASFDYCCRGSSSSYYLVVGRSRKITGPYVGRDGSRMLDGYGTLLLQGDERFRGPGHNAVLRDAGLDYLVYHAYDAENEGRPTLRISPIDWDTDGWPNVTLQ
jgi:arabinan endo-1,5-alpha-L-arabinosidase